jgi:hypothetical protein
MKKFEYKLIYRDYGLSTKELQAKLNTLGEQGWELIAVYETEHYFKRELQ